MKCDTISDKEANKHALQFEDTYSNGWITVSIQ